VNFLERAYASFINRVSSGVAAEVRASLENPSTPLSAVFAEPKTTTGISVTEERALSIGAVFSCVKVISETFGLMDLEIQKKKGKFNEHDPSHPLNLLIRDPSPYFNRYQWMQAVITHILLWGNAYNKIVRNRYGDPVEIKILQPYDVTPKLSERGRLFYEYAQGNTTEIIRPENILHFKNLTTDGLLGLSIVSIQRESLANSIAKVQHEGAFYANGAKASGILMTPGNLGGKERDNLQTSFEKANSGAKNRFKTIVLEEGVKYQQLTIPQNDAQFLESKNYDRSEIAGWFRVPPYKIGYMDNANYSNVEAQERSFARDAIVPHAVNIQQEFDRKLFFEDERGVQRTQFNTDDITKGDMKTRYEAHNTGIQAGFLTPKEVRDAEGWPTDNMPELDQFFMNSTMLPVKTILMQPAPGEKPKDEKAA
jgi:HK97 family phage portal protein